MTKKTAALYEALPEIAKGYINALLKMNGFWPDEDRREMRKWESRDEHSFTPDAYVSITADSRRYLELLATEMGGIDIMVDAIGDWQELGYSLWMVRQGSGHEPDFGNCTVDQAIMAAARKLGEAYTEIGYWGRISHC